MQHFSSTKDVDATPQYSMKECLTDRNEENSKQKKTTMLQCIKNNLIKKTQNSMKLNLCDHEAFEWKLKRSQDAKMLETHSLIFVDKTLRKIEKVKLKNLLKIQFPVLAYTNSELVEHTMKIIETIPFAVNNFGLKMLRNLVLEISKNYNIVAYHNFSHAFSLTLMLFQSFEREKHLKNAFSEEEIFFSYLAGLAHDLNHPGTNNAYEAKMKTKIAVQSGYQSILQKFHLRELWRIIKDEDDINFLKHVKDETQTKKFITRLILSTDMAQHFGNLNLLKQKRSQPKDMTETSQEDKHFFLEQLFHASDIGNACIDFDNYMNWAALLSYQFDNQTKLQAENRVQITEYFKYRSLHLFYKGQIGFLSSFVLPIWKQLNDIWTDLSPFRENIENNIRILNQRCIQEQEKQLRKQGQLSLE